MVNVNAFNFRLIKFISTKNEGKLTLKGNQAHDLLSDLKSVFRVGFLAFPL